MAPDLFAFPEIDVRRIFLISGLLLILAAPRAGRAQSIHVDAEAAPLAETLSALSAQTGVDVVFSQRLVTGRTATCRYDGADALDALRCVLHGTGLDVQRVRDRQYVLVLGAATVAQKPLVRRGTLSGFVVDGETGEVLPGAHVLLTDRAMGTTTNEAGYFALPAYSIDAHRVRVSFLGYQTLDTLLVMRTMAATLSLRSTTLTTGGLVVEAPRDDLAERAGEPGLVAVPVSRLEKLPASLGGQDLFQALEWMPGIERSGEVTGGLLVRGSGPDENLYLLDGAPIYHPWHAFSLISTFQTDTFKDIRFYKGSFPAEHGGRLSSVLDAELKDGSRSTPRLVTAINPLNARFVIESPITRNSSFMISGRRSYIDKIIGRKHPVEDERGRRDTLRTGYYFYDWSAKLTVRTGPKSRFSASYYNGRDVLDLRLPFDLSLDFASWLRPAGLFFEVGQRWGNTLYSLRYQYLFSPRLFLTVTGYDSRYDASENTFVQPTSSASVTSAYGVNLHDLGVKIDLDYYRSLKHQIRGGVRVINHRFRSSLDALIERSPGAVEALVQKSRLHSGEVVSYVQDVWQPAPRWRIEPGLRFSAFSSGAYSRLNPRLSVQFIVDPAYLVLNASVSTQSQFVHRLRDRFSFLYDLVSSRWIPSSETVRPAQGEQVSVGLESHPRPGVTITAEAYLRGARDVLLPLDEFQTKDGLEGPGIEVGTLLSQYVTGRERSYGVETGATVARGPWQMQFGYVAGRSLNRAPSLGEDRYRPARYDAPHTFRGSVQRQGRRWQFGLAGQWRSGYPITVPVARYALGGPLQDEPVRYLYRPRINNGRLPNYLRLDVTVGYRFGWVGGRWNAQIHLYNALNRRNVIGRFFDPEQEIVRGQDRHGLPILPLFNSKWNSEPMVRPGMRIKKIGLWMACLAPALAVLTGCDSVQPQEGPRLVVEAFFDAEKPLPPLVLRRSAPLGEPYTEGAGTAVTDASVVLTLDGQPIRYIPGTTTPGRYVPLGASRTVPERVGFSLDVEWRTQEAVA